MIKFTLNNGVKIPAIGSGTNTFGKENNNYMGAINNDTSPILSAIDAGYRHFDTAISYRNESVLGLAIKQSGLARNDFFITSKLPGKPEYTQNDEAVRQGVSDSLKALGTDYIDLYLIHHPWDNLEEILSVWKVLETYVELGILRAIGVSNFNEEQLAYLIDNAKIKPAVNQVESHPGKWNDDVIEFGKKHGIIAEAWGPLTAVSEDAKAVLTNIGSKYNASWAQVALKYQLDRGVIVIPKSHNPQRQIENINLDHIVLSDEDRSTISSL